MGRQQTADPVQAVQHKEFDVIAFETVPSLEEGRAIAHLLRTESLGPAWLTFNCKDESLLTHGESFAGQAVPLAFEVDRQPPPLQPPSGLPPFSTSSSGNLRHTCLLLTPYFCTTYKALVQTSNALTLICGSELLEGELNE